MMADGSFGDYTNDFWWGIIIICGNPVLNEPELQLVNLGQVMYVGYSNAFRCHFDGILHPMVWISNLW